jgi:hypothetical protein
MSADLALWELPRQSGPTQDDALILLWGIVVGVGTGLTEMVLAATVATRWFNHRRGCQARHSGVPSRMCTCSGRFAEAATGGVSSQIRHSSQRHGCKCSRGVKGCSAGTSVIASVLGNHRGTTERRFEAELDAASGSLARHPLTLLQVKALLGHATRHDALGQLSAHVLRRCPRHLGFRYFSAALLQSEFIRRPVWSPVQWCGLLRATNHECRYHRWQKAVCEPNAPRRSSPFRIASDSRHAICPSLPLRLGDLRPRQNGGRVRPVTQRSAAGIARLIHVPAAAASSPIWAAGAATVKVSLTVRGDRRSAARISPSPAAAADFPDRVRNISSARLRDG